jgi:hypothetical protein
MPHRNDLYGFSDLTLAEAKTHVEAVLGITLGLRDSMYAELYYAGKDSAGRSFQLQENDEEHGLRAYEKYCVLLSVSDVVVSDEIEHKLRAGGRAVLLRTRVLSDDPDDSVTEIADPSMPHRRYDLYGFQTMSLDEAKRFVEDALGIAFARSELSIWGEGGYYCVPNGDVWDYILYRNTGTEPEHPRFRAYGVVLSVEDVADMDEIQRKLTEGRTEPVHLRTERLPRLASDE